MRYVAVCAALWCVVLRVASCCDVKCCVVFGVA